jgi:hypothetical protein
MASINLCSDKLLEVESLHGRLSMTLTACHQVDPLSKAGPTYPPPAGPEDASPWSLNDAGYFSLKTCLSLFVILYLFMIIETIQDHLQNLRHYLPTYLPACLSLFI